MLVGGRVGVRVRVGIGERVGVDATVEVGGTVEVVMAFVSVGERVGARATVEVGGTVEVVMVFVTVGDKVGVRVEGCDVALGDTAVATVCGAALAALVTDGVEVRVAASTITAGLVGVAVSAGGGNKTGQKRQRPKPPPARNITTAMPMTSVGARRLCRALAPTAAATACANSSAVW